MTRLGFSTATIAILDLELHPRATADEPGADQEL
jgi:hypothetical protein